MSLILFSKPFEACRAMPATKQPMRPAQRLTEPSPLAPVMVEFPPGVRLHLLADLAEQANCVLEMGKSPRTLRLVPRDAALQRGYSTAPDLAPEGI